MNKTPIDVPDYAAAKSVDRDVIPVIDLSSRYLPEERQFIT